MSCTIHINSHLSSGITIVAYCHIIQITFDFTDISFYSCYLIILNGNINFYFNVSAFIKFYKVVNIINIIISDYDIYSYRTAEVIFL